MTLIYPNIVPENNLRLPDALTVKHGPARLLFSAAGAGMRPPKARFAADSALQGNRIRTLDPTRALPAAHQSDSSNKRGRARTKDAACGPAKAGVINAPSSTKNADKARDPEMHQTRKGNQWYFRYVDLSCRVYGRTPSPNQRAWSRRARWRDIRQCPHRLRSGTNRRGRPRGRPRVSRGRRCCDWHACSRSRR